MRTALLTGSRFKPESLQTLDTDEDLNSTYFNASFFGRDTLHLYTHFFPTDPASDTPLPDFKVQVATNGSGSPGVLGMGPSSTVLQELYNAGKVAGRTYSLYVGSASDRAGGAINGSSTFGGYDAGRFTGPVHEYAMQSVSADPFRVRVRDIILDEPGTTARNISLFDPAQFPEMSARPQPFEARITTDRYPLALPRQITANFAARTAATSSDNPDGSLRLGRPFNGSLTIVLEDGFAVTLPPDVVANASSLSPVAAAPEDEEDEGPFYLSVAWLSQVYLMADYDSFKFFLAPAVAEEKYVMLTTFCPRTVPEVYAPPARTLGSTGLIGLIVASVVGGIIAVLLGWVVFTVLMRKRWARKARESAHGEAKVRAVESDESDVGSEKGGQGKKKPRVMFWRRGSS